MKLSSDEIIYFPPAPDPDAPNFLHLYKGEVKLGKLMMIDANLQMIDKDPSDYLDFYIEKYYPTLVNGGSAFLRTDLSVKVLMPDYDDVFR